MYEVKDIDANIENIPIKAFPGIGKGFQKRLEEHYISTLGDVKRHKILFESWEKPGIQLYRRVTRTDHEGISSKEERKSIGISRTFDPIYDKNEINRRMMLMASHIVYMVMAIETNPTSYYLKIGYEHGVKVKKTLTVDRIFSETLFKAMLAQMYEAISLTKKGAVKLTLSVSNFSSLKLKTLSLIEFNDDSKEKITSKYT